MPRRGSLLPAAAKDLLKPMVSGLLRFCRRRPHFFPAFAAALWFVRNVESTYFSERCRFYSEMRRCAGLHFAFSAAAGIEAGRFGWFSPCRVRVGRRTAKPMCGARADPQTAGLNGVFGHFCRREQKRQRRGRGMSPAAAERNGAAGGKKQHQSFPVIIPPQTSMLMAGR